MVGKKIVRAGKLVLRHVTRDTVLRGGRAALGRLRWGRRPRPGVTGKALGIIGCGAIGHKRAFALSESMLVACTDALTERAVALAARFPGAEPVSDWPTLLARPDVDAVIVSTTHDALAAITKCPLMTATQALRDLDLGVMIEVIR